MSMNKAYISAELRILRLSENDVIVTSVAANGLNGFGGNGGSSTGRPADAPGRRSLWD